MAEVIKAEYSGKRNLIGERFHWLTVKKYVGYRLDGKGKKIWMCECRCKCGNLTTCQHKGLLSGNTKSCGCWQKTRASESNKTHGKSKTGLYFVWRAMIKRCSPSAKG